MSSQPEFWHASYVVYPNIIYVLTSKYNKTRLVSNSITDRHFQNKKGFRSIKGINSLALRNLGLGVDRSYKNSDKLS